MAPLVTFSTTMLLERRARLEVSIQQAEIDRREWKALTEELVNRGYYAKTIFIPELDDYDSETELPNFVSDED